MDHQLPKRFWLKSEFPKGEKPPSTFANLKTAKFRKFYNKVVNPQLKAEGFKTKGFNALKVDEERQLAFQVFFGGSKWGGRGCASIGVHPLFCSTKDFMEWDLEKHQFFQSLFKHNLYLPNGNQDFDLGFSEEMATETAQYILEAYQRSAPDWFAWFDSFPAPFLGMPVAQYEQQWEELVKKSGMKTEHSRRIVSYSIHFARINKQFGEEALAREYIDFGRKMNEELGKADEYFPGPNEHLEEQMDKIFKA